jgi:hypothetical protein
MLEVLPGFPDGVVARCREMWRPDHSPGLRDRSSARPGAILRPCVGRDAGELSGH